jgi:Uma2 family endonuclease
MSSAARVTKPPKPVGSLPPAIPPFPVRRFTVEEYHQLLETGALKSREPYELIHGWIVPKMGINPPHNFAVNRLMKALLALANSIAVVRVQQPITTNDSEPEPDTVLAFGRDADYKARNPGPSEVIVVVEVADSTLREDRTTKLHLYAGAGIAVYWIVNLKNRCVEVYTQPRGEKNPSYAKKRTYRPGDEVPVVIRGKELGRISVKELLP